MGRRSTGTVEPLKTAIRLKFTLRGARCVETMNLPPTPANLKAAHRLLERVVGAIRAGVYRHDDFFDSPARQNDKRTFGEYADAWLETLVLAKSTQRLYATAIKVTWAPAIGDTPLTQLRYSDIQAVVAKRVKLVSHQTMNNHLSVLRQVLNAAVADEIIPHSPAEKVKNLSTQKARPDPFTSAERELILGRMKEKCPAQVLNYYAFAFHTGMRPSELIALRWGDVDWAKANIRVSRAKVEREEKSTKTNRERTVDLNDAALAAITRQKEHTFMKSGAIFENPRTGKPWANDQVQRMNYFTPTLKALGIRERDAYQTRHTFATLLLMGGVNPKYISRQLGHASLAMLFEVYGGWLETEDAGAQAQKANEVLAGIVHESSTEKRG